MTLLTLLTPLVLEHETLLRRFAQAPARPLPETKKDLAAELGRDPSNLNKTLKLLEGEGLTYPGGGFGAAEKLGISEKGRQALAALDRANDVQAAPDTRSSSEAVAHENAAPAGFVWLTHAEIRPDPNNARKDFDEEALAELADSMAEKGLLQKPAVRLIEGEPPRSSSEAVAHEYAAQLALGERRWRAWGLLIERGVWFADHRELCPIVAGDDAFAEEAGLIENLQRKDLKPLEEARGFQRLIETHGHTTATIAAKVGFTQRFVQQRLQLLELKPDDMKALDAGKLTIEDARRRIACYPKPLELTPEQLLVFLEVAQRHAKLDLDIGYNHQAPVDYAIDGDDTVKALRLLGVLGVSADYETCVPTVRLDWTAPRALLQYTGVDSPEAEAIEPRLELARAEAGHVAPEEGRYCTPWLNEPFNPDPEALAAQLENKAHWAEQNARQAAARQAREEQAAAAQTAAESFLDAVRAFEDSLAADPTSFGERLAAMLQQHRPTPWSIVWSEQSAYRNALPDPAIHDALGRPNAGPPAMVEALRRVMILTVNHACGWPLVSGPWDPPAAPTDLDRDTFEAKMAERLQEAYADESYTDALARAQRLLASYLDENGVDFGDEGMTWDEESARDLTDDLDAEDMRADLDAEDAADALEPAQ